MTTYAAYSESEQRYLQAGGDVFSRPLLSVIEPAPDEYLEGAARWSPDTGWFEVDVVNEQVDDPWWPESLRPDG